MKNSRADTDFVSGIGLFCLVFSYMSAGLLLFRVTSFPDILFTLFCATVVFTVIAAGADGKAKGPHALLTGLTGRRFAGLTEGALALVSLITLCSDGNALTAFVSSLCGLSERTVGIGLILLAVFAAGRGPGTVSNLAQAGMLLFLGAFCTAFFFLAKAETGTFFYPASALRAFGGSGAFFSLVSHVRVGKEGSEDGNTESKRPGRRLTVFLPMAGGTLCAVLFSFIILSADPNTKMQTFFSFITWCLALIRLSLLLFSLIDYAKGPETPLSKAVFLSALWIAWTVLIGVPFNDGTPFSGGMILAVCLNMIPLLFLTLFSLLSQEEKEAGGYPG